MVAQAEIDGDVEYEPSEIQKFYEGTHIFITGGTGFLGMLLVQKLIRNCPGLAKIYLLIRTKKEKTPEQRMEDMFHDVVFERMKLERPNYKEKVELLIGDLEQSDLGLNEKDKETIMKEVDVVFHLAATVRFDEKIKKASNINVRATKDIVNLAKNMKKLKAFIHCSTAFSNCTRKDIGEEFYDTHILPERLLEITEVLNDEELKVLTPKLLGKWPNTYTFTKSLAEKVVQTEGKDLPCSVVRPSMVIPTVCDPIDGWINNFYGPVGVAMGSGAGVLRVMRLCKDYSADMVPADFVVNNVIVAGQYVGKKSSTDRLKDEDEEITKSDGIPVFNCIVGNENHLTWDDYKEYRHNCLKYTTIHAIWYYILIFNANPYIVKFLKIFIEKLPALIMDGVLFAIGKKPKMMKMYEKIDTFTDVIEYFTTHEWKFCNNNTQALWKKMNKTDKRLFTFSMKEFDWSNYFFSFGKGLRVYLFKDPLETLPKAHAKYRKLKFAHYTLMTFLCCLAFYVTVKIIFMFV